MRSSWQGLCMRQTWWGCSWQQFEKGMCAVRFTEWLHTSELWWTVELCCLEWSKTKAVHDELFPVHAAEDLGLEQLAWRAPYKPLLLSQEFKADMSLSDWREGAAEGTSASRQPCSVVVCCAGHVCFSGGAQLLPGSGPQPYQAGLAFHILSMISRIYRG